MSEERKGADRAEWLLTLIGTATALLALTDVGDRAVLLGSLSLLATAGICVAWREHRMRERPSFIAGGALRGLGYVRDFESASSSLLLMHVDDDSPSGELLDVYARKLDSGIIVRRLVIVRPNHSPPSIEWAAELPSHPNFQQRFVDSQTDAVMPLSFAIIDEKTVLVAVPGYRAGESGPLADRLILRHLIRLTGPEEVQCFVETYEAMWRANQPDITAA